MIRQSLGLQQDEILTVQRFDGVEHLIAYDPATGLVCVGGPDPESLDAVAGGDEMWEWVWELTGDEALRLPAGYTTLLALPAIAATADEVAAGVAAGAVKVPTCLHPPLILLL